MSPGKISKRVVADRLNWINKMIQEIKSLPIEGYDSFALDKRNSLAAESCLRRSLEALMDLGRHILAKGFSRGVSEYKEIASGLEEAGIFNEAKSAKFKTLAGYRNRMVNFYNEISNDELYQICSSQLSDIIDVAEVIKRWVNKNPDIMDEKL